MLIDVIKVVCFQTLLYLWLFRNFDSGDTLQKFKYKYLFRIKHMYNCVVIYSGSVISLILEAQKSLTQCCLMTFHHPHPLNQSTP